MKKTCSILELAKLLEESTLLEPRFVYENGELSFFIEPQRWQNMLDENCRLQRMERALQKIANPEWKPTGKLPDNPVLIAKEALLKEAP